MDKEFKGLTKTELQRFAKIVKNYNEILAAGRLSSVFDYTKTRTQEGYVLKAYANIEAAFSAAGLDVEKVLNGTMTLDTSSAEAQALVEEMRKNEPLTRIMSIKNIDLCAQVEELKAKVDAYESRPDYDAAIAKLAQVEASLNALTTSVADSSSAFDRKLSAGTNDIKVSLHRLESELKRSTGRAAGAGIAIMRSIAERMEDATDAVRNDLIVAINNSAIDVKNHVTYVGNSINAHTSSESGLTRSHVSREAGATRTHTTNETNRAVDTISDKIDDTAEYIINSVKPAKKIWRSILCGILTGTTVLGIAGAAFHATKQGDYAKALNDSGSAYTEEFNELQTFNKIVIKAAESEEDVPYNEMYTIAINYVNPENHAELDRTQINYENISESEIGNLDKIASYYAADDKENGKVISTTDSMLSEIENIKLNKKVIDLESQTDGSAQYFINEFNEYANFDARIKEMSAGNRELTSEDFGKLNNMINEAMKTDIEGMYSSTPAMNARYDLECEKVKSAKSEKDLKNIEDRINEIGQEVNAETGSNVIETLNNIYTILKSNKETTDLSGLYSQIEYIYMNVFGKKVEIKDEATAERCIKEALQELFKTSQPENGNGSEMGDDNGGYERD